MKPHFQDINVLAEKRLHLKEIDCQYNSKNVITKMWKLGLFADQIFSFLSGRYQY